MIKNREERRGIKSFFFAFILLAVLAIGSTIYAFFQMASIHTITTNIYEHPLKVSNAALMVDLDIYKIQNHMKDVVLSSSQEHLNKLIDEIERHERDVYSNLHDIKDNILGSEGRMLVEQTSQLFRAWKPIRDEVIILVDFDLISGSEVITLGSDERHVLALEDSVSKLYTYAQNKAEGFKEQSNTMFQKVVFSSLFISISLLVLFILLIYYTVQRLRKYILKDTYFNGMIAIIRDLETLIVTEKEPQRLIEESCDIFTSNNVYDNAWIVLVDDSGSIEHTATSGYSSNHFIEFEEKLKSGWTPHCISKTTQSEADDSITMNVHDECPECPLTGHVETGTSLNIALIHDERLYGYLTLSIEGKYVAAYDENTLQYEAARDIAYALYNLQVKKDLVVVQERYRFASEAAADGIWDWDFLNDSIYFSPTLKSMIGYRDEEMPNVYEEWEKRIHPDDKGQILIDVQASRESETGAYRNIHRLKHKDGHWVWIEARGKTIFDAEGRAIRMIGSHTDITERKRAQEQLQTSNDKFEKTFNTTPSLIIITHLDTGRVYDVNRTFEETFGHRKEDIIGKTTADIGLWADLDERQEYIDTLRDEGFVKGTVNSFLTRDGKVVIAQTFASLVTIGEERYILAVADDITSEKALEIENRKFLDVLDQSMNELHVFDLEELHYTYVNKAGLSKLGYTMEEMRTFTPMDILDGVMSEEAIREMLRPLFEGQKSMLFDDARQLRKDGTIYPVETRLQVIEIEGRSQVVATVIDMTDKEKILQLLEQKRMELETIIREAPNPIMLYDEDGEVLMVNKIWEQLSGYHHTDIDTIDRWTEKAYGKNIPVTKTAIDRLYSSGTKVDEGEKSIVTGHGDSIIWQFSSAPLGMMDGRRVIISSAMDITELKKKDELMIIQSRHAAMGEMIGMISHQWRQPLAIIAMGANNMLADIEFEELSPIAVEEHSRTILKQTGHLSKTIDDFRYFFRPEQEKEAVSIMTVLDETEKVIGPSLVSNDIELVIENSSDSSTMIHRRELMQVFINLLNNAKDAVIANTEDNRKIMITVEEDEESMSTTICDNGGGIEDAIIEKVFDPYFTTKEELNGTGLGLYISKTIIDKHFHGHISVVNSDTGSCFKVRFPR